MYLPAKPPTEVKYLFKNNLADARFGVSVEPFTKMGGGAVGAPTCKAPHTIIG